MPLSDHEQRMLDQIESALYAEDPKFASSVRGGGLRAPTARRRLQGAGLFVLGLAMLVSGVAFKATMIGTFPALSVVGFIVMFGGVVFAITGPRLAGRGERSGSSAAARKHRNKGAGGLVTTRMEDRFRRRFEELGAGSTKGSQPAALFCAPLTPDRRPDARSISHYAPLGAE